MILATQFPYIAAIRLVVSASHPTLMKVASPGLKSGVDKIVGEVG